MARKHLLTGISASPVQNRLTAALLKRAPTMRGAVPRVR